MEQKGTPRIKIREKEYNSYNTTYIHHSHAHTQNLPS